MSAEQCSPAPGQRDQLLAFAIGAILLFWNLGSRALLGDEGQTGFMALQTLRHGLPICPEDYGVGWWVEFLGARLLVLHPWVDCYLGGLGVAVFGADSFGLRFFFALFGTAFFPLMYGLAFRLSGSRRTAILAVALALSNPALLIYLRAARYYPTSLVAVTVILLLWHDGSESMTRVRAILLSAWCFLLSFAFLPAGLVLNTILLVALVRRPRYLWVPIPGLLAALFFFLTLKFYGANLQNAIAMTPGMRFHGFIEMLVELNRHYIPLWVIACYALMRSGISGLPAIFSFLYGVSLIFGSWFAVRYLVPVFPLCFAMYAAFLERIWGWRRSAAIAILPIVLMTNVAGASLWQLADPFVRAIPGVFAALPTRTSWSELQGRFGRFEWTFPRAFDSILRSEPTSTDGVVRFLRETARPGDGIYMMELVAVYRFYFPDMCVVYHTKLAEELGPRLRFVLPNRYRDSESWTSGEIRSDVIGWAEARGFRPATIEAPDVFYGNPWFDEYMFRVPEAPEKVRIWIRPE